MKRFSSSILVLVFFVVIYILCIVAYTFISGLKDVNLFDREVRPEYDAFSRVRRALPGKNDTWKTNILFNVCCGKDEYMNSSFECVKANVSRGYETEDKAGTLFKNVVLDEDSAQSYINSERIVLKYKFDEKCPSDEITAITWSEGQTYSYYIAQKNGYLLELSNDRKSIVSNYSTSSFCLDTTSGPEGSRLYVALLCPCKENVCIQKCCPKGSYFNIATSSCKEESEDGIESYKPDSFEYRSYHLMNGVPKCDGPDRMITNRDEHLEINIMGDGHLVTLSKERGIFNRKKYCLDIFSNGDKNKSYVNGFFCPNEVNKFMGKNIMPQKVDGNSYSPAGQNFINLFVIVLCSLFCIFKYTI